MMTTWHSLKKWLLLATLGVLAACQSTVVPYPAPLMQGTAQTSQPAKPVPPKASSPARVALLYPLTGQHAPIGKALLSATQLAFFQARPTSLELLCFDTKGTSEGASEAMEQAISHSASLALGPLTAQEVRTITPLAKQHQIPVLAFSNDRSVAGQGIFALGILPDDHVRDIITFAATKGARTFAAVLPQNAYGHAVAKTLQETLIGLNIADPATIVYYTPQDLSDMEPLKALKGHAFDAILIPEGGETLKILASYLSYWDLKTSHTYLLGLDPWRETPNLSTDPHVVGAFFAALPQERARKYQEAYQHFYQESPHPLAGLAYDATTLAIALQRQGMTFDMSHLMSAQGFLGVYGVFRLVPSGVSERHLDIYEVTKDGTQIVKPAMTVF